MAAILDFQSELFYLFLIYKSAWYFLSSFESIGLTDREKKFKTDFPDGGNGGHHEFPIVMILANFSFDLQVTPIVSTKFAVNFQFRRKSSK